MDLRDLTNTSSVITQMIRLAFCARAPFALHSPRTHARARWLCTSEHAPKRIVFLGTPPVAAASLGALIAGAPAADAEVVAVVTRPPARVGRSRTLQQSPVHVEAEKLGIASVLTPARARDESFLEALEELRPDLCVTAAYGCILPQRFLDTPRFGTLNIHPSLLPHFRGAAPVPRALEAGVTETGVSVAWTVLALDAGPVVATRIVRPEPDEVAPELLARLFALGTDALLEALPSVWDRSAPGTPQDDAHATHAPKLSKDEARLTFVENARIVHNKVRAFAGWPGTWADFDVGDRRDSNFTEVRLKVVRTRVLREQGGMCLGVHDVTFDDEHNCLRVICDDGSGIGVFEVQPQGKKVMTARAFWNGMRGKRFGRKRVPH